MKECRKCNNVKEDQEFEQGRRVCKVCRKLNQKLCYEANKELRKEKSKQWINSNPEKYKVYKKKSRIKHKDKERNWYLNRRFGITLDTFKQMEFEQNGVCKICGNKELTNKHLSVDHDHITGKIRGLLCAACNTALGLMKDNIDNLESAIRYLRNEM